MAKKAAKTRDTRRVEVIREISLLVAELAQLELDGSRPNNTNQERSDNGGPPLVHKEGARVRITRRDAYWNRCGTIISPHGELYWNVLLDKRANETTSKIIQKTPKYLKVLPPPS